MPLTQPHDCRQCLSLSRTTVDNASHLAARLRTAAGSHEEMGSRGWQRAVALWPWQHRCEYSSARSWIDVHLNGYICSTAANRSWKRSVRLSAPARLLEWWFRTTSEAWMSLSCECCVLSGIDPSDWLIPRPGETYRVCVCMCVCVCVCLWVLPSATMTLCNHNE
jgi:hypothetical protein